MKTIHVKILSYRSPQRYAVQRTVHSAFQMIHQAHPNLEIEILEIKEIPEILKITPILILPSLVIEDELVCKGRFPKKDEVLKWLNAAL